jgi:hypothetical protein
LFCVVSVFPSEYTYCSNRGNCDYLTGTCICYSGFGGAACSNVTYLYDADSISTPGLIVDVNALNFSSSVLLVQSAKSPSPDFNLIEANANSNVMFYVSGDGTVGANKLKTLSGGQTISGGGLFIEEGGATIADSGLSIYSISSSDPVVLVSSGYSGPLASSYNVLQLSSLSTWANNFYLINAQNQGKTKFAVRGDGAVFIHGGGLQVTSGITVVDSGLSVNGGLSIGTGGLVVLEKGILVTGGVSINSNGMKIASGGIQVYGGASINSGGMKVFGGASVTSGGLSVNNGVTVSTNGIRLSGGLTVSSSGVTVSGGLTVSTAGLRVISGGMTVANGGFYVTGGFTVGNNGMFVNSGGAKVTGGLSVGNGGLFLADSGASIASGGIYLGGNGLTVAAGGLAVVQGISVNSFGMFVSGGLTVTNAQLIAAAGAGITGGLSVFSSGLYSSAGATIGGNTVLNGLTVSSNSVFTSGSVTFGGGVFISGGLTVHGTVESQFVVDVYSDRRLKTNLSPIFDALHKVSKLKGVYFDWIQNEAGGMTFDKNRHIGVIAQEVEQVVPEAVSNPKGGKYLGVDYQALVPVLIEAIHDLQNIISELKQNQTRVITEIELLKKSLKLGNYSISL